MKGFENMSPEQEREFSNALLEKKETKVFAAKKLAKFIELDFKLSIFGITLLEWHYPPMEERKNE